MATDTNNHPGGYTGKFLRVNMTSGELTNEFPDEKTIRMYPGGSSFGVHVLYSEVPPGVEWNDPENRLVLSGGPLSGTRVPGSGTFSVVTKGPMTNGGTTTQANGFFSAFMKSAGFDGLILEGASDGLKYLYLHDGVAELKDASHLAGKDTTETEQALKQELGKNNNTMSVFCIGPAGENLVRYACLVGDRGHVAAHNGTGAVMGSKKLKAIAIARSSNGPQLHDEEKFKEIAQEYRNYLKESNDQIQKWGTLRIMERATQAGTLLTKNYTTNVYDKDLMKDYTPENIRENYEAVRHSCWACSAHHCHELTIQEGRHAGLKVEEPEYEGLTAWGNQIGVYDLNETLFLSDLVDRLGMDLNESSWVVGLLMECYEKGLITKQDMDGLELDWGNVDAVATLLNKMARREGVGDMLAEGAKNVAAKIGGQAPSFAVHTLKGNTPRSHDHRLNWREMFDTSVSNTGTLEAAWQIAPPNLKEDFGMTPLADPFDGMAVSSYVAGTKGGLLFEDSLGVCNFCTKGQVSQLVASVNAATGWDMTVEEALNIGRRGVNLLRAFNIRQGISPELDRPSPRYGSTPTDGNMAGRSIAPVYDDMLNNYYEKMGWSKEGVPTPETLQQLGIGEVAKDLG